MLLETEGLFIQVSGLTSEADALFAVALGATAVGFDFGPTPRQISAHAVHDIVRRLPVGVITVGTFYNEMPERIVEITNTLGLSAVQIEGLITRSALGYVAERVRTVIRSVRSAPDAYEYEGVESVDYLHVAAPLGESLSPELHHLLGDPLMLRPLIVGGLGHDRVADVVGHYDVWGVDALEGIESSPGVKDAFKMGEYIANARGAEASALTPRPTWPPTGESFEGEI